MERLEKELMSQPSRQVAAEMLDCRFKTRQSVVEVAKAMSVPTVGTRTDIINRIVDATTGAVLRSQAIQGL